MITSNWLASIARGAAAGCGVAGFTCCGQRITSGEATTDWGSSNDGLGVVAGGVGFGVRKVLVSSVTIFPCATIAFSSSLSEALMFASLCFLASLTAALASISKCALPSTLFCIREIPSRSSTNVDNRSCGASGGCTGERAGEQAGSGTERVFCVTFARGQAGTSTWSMRLGDGEAEPAGEGAVRACERVLGAIPPCVSP